MNCIIFSSSSSYLSKNLLGSKSCAKCQNNFFNASEDDAILEDEVIGDEITGRKIEDNFLYSKIKKFRDGEIEVSLHHKPLHDTCNKCNLDAKSNLEVGSRDIDNMPSDILEILFLSKKIQLIHTFGSDNNQGVLELIFILDILQKYNTKGDLNKKIDLIVPYVVYSRQDKFSLGVSQGCMVFFKMLQNYKDLISSFTCFDLHFDVSYLEILNLEFAVINKTPASLFINCLFNQCKKHGWNQENLCIVMPDESALTRLSKNNKEFNIINKFSIIVMQKKRNNLNSMTVEVNKIYGEPEKCKNFIFFDDMVSSGQSVAKNIELIEKLFSAREKNFILFCTHFFSNIVEISNISKIAKIFTTNSLELRESDKKRLEGIEIEVVNIMQLL